jgi:uncharacterized protein YbaP (TraB family)
MKKITIVVVLFLSTTFAFSQQKQQSLLWEISGNGLQKPSYIFGTVHMICSEDFIFPDLLREKFINANEVFLELDMDDPNMIMKMMGLLQLPKGQTIKKLFGDSAFKSFDSSYTKITGSSASMFNGLKPFMLMSILTEKMLPCSSKESYEQNFITLAAKYKKDIKGLETIEDQVAVFDSIPDSVEVANLKEMVTNFQKQVDEFKKLVAVYKTQDIDSLFNITQTGVKDLEAESELLTKRNSKWIPVMKTNMQKTSCFFAVGAAHLGGNIGVLALLRKEGYTVKPVKLQ